MDELTLPISRLGIPKPDSHLWSSSIALDVTCDNWTDMSAFAQSGHFSCTAHVCSWGKADMFFRGAHVCF